MFAEKIRLKEKEIEAMLELAKALKKINSITIYELTVT